MLKPLLITLLLFTSSCFSIFYTQVKPSVVSKFETNQYELSFTETDFIKVKQMQQFIEDITVATDILFIDAQYQVIVKTKKVLEKNIIYGKFRKQEVKLLTFVKL